MMSKNYDVNQQNNPRPAAPPDIKQREIARPGPASTPTPSPQAGMVPTATPSLKQVRRIVGGGVPE
jgi:hypothetical protein